MKWHFLKKQVTAILFLGVLAIFAIVNGIHTLPHLLEVFTLIDEEIDTPKEMITKIENTINENILGRIWFVEGYGVWNNLLGKNEINNFAHIKDDKGFIHYSNFWNNETSDVEEIMQQVIALKERLERKGTELVVLIPPSKDMTEYISFDKGMPYSDRNWIADDYVKALKKNGIRHLDFREVLKESGMAYEDIFYRTDHHWTTQAAYLSFTTFVEQMNKWFELELDPKGLYTNADNYNTLIYKASSLGSHGRQVGIAYSGGLDDFTVMYPKYPTHLEYKYKTQMDAEAIELKGRFEEILLSTPQLTNDNIYEKDKYTTYLNGVTAMDEIKNTTAPNAPKVLFLRDSFSSPFGAFAAQVFSETDLIWTLKLQGNLDELIKDKVYDYVIISLYPDSLTSNMFQFDTVESK